MYLSFMSVHTVSLAHGLSQYQLQFTLYIVVELHAELRESLTAPTKP
jgi:hypothetical protein